jgi:hypothetical protein
MQLHRFTTKEEAMVYLMSQHNPDGVAIKFKGDSKYTVIFADELYHDSQERDDYFTFKDLCETVAGMITTGIDFAPYLVIHQANKINF